MITRLKHIKSKKVRLASGEFVTYRYHRKTNRRIFGAPGTPEFLKSYQEAASFKQKNDAETLGWLIGEYKRAQEFSRLAP